VTLDLDPGLVSQQNAGWAVPIMTAVELKAHSPNYDTLHSKKVAMLDTVAEHHVSSAVHSAVQYNGS
jgi:hypothetical protein